MNKEDRDLKMKRDNAVLECWTNGAMVGIEAVELGLKAGLSIFSAIEYAKKEIQRRCEMKSEENPVHAFIAFCVANFVIVALISLGGCVTIETRKNANGKKELAKAQILFIKYKAE